MKTACTTFNPEYSFKPYLIWYQVDLLFGSDRDQLLRLAGFLKELAPFEEVFPISAARGKGINDLRDYLIGRCAVAGRCRV